jgi:hypothetical protein
MLRELPLVGCSYFVAAEINADNIMCFE